MASVGIRELRQNLSVYVRRVKAGETLEVTEHGRPVAVLAPLPNGADPIARLEREGRIARHASGRIEDLGPPLPVERSSAVRRALNEIQAEIREERISRNEAAPRIVELVDHLGLQPLTLDDLPEPIDVDDLGVVCWMAVLPAR